MIHGALRVALLVMSTVIIAVCGGSLLMYGHYRTVSAVWLRW